MNIYMQVLPATVWDRAFASDDESSPCSAEDGAEEEEEAEGVESEEVAGDDEVLSAKESRASYTAAKSNFVGTSSEWAASEERKQEFKKMPISELRRRRVI